MRVLREGLRREADLRTRIPRQACLGGGLPLHTYIAGAKVREPRLLPTLGSRESCPLSLLSPLSPSPVPCTFISPVAAAAAEAAAASHPFRYTTNSFALTRASWLLLLRRNPGIYPYYSLSLLRYVCARHSSPPLSCPPLCRSQRPRSNDPPPSHCRDDFPIFLALSRCVCAPSIKLQRRFFVLEMPRASTILFLFLMFLFFCKYISLCRGYVYARIRNFFCFYVGGVVILTYSHWHLVETARKYTPYVRALKRCW